MSGAKNDWLLGRCEGLNTGRKIDRVAAQRRVRGERRTNSGTTTTTAALVQNCMRRNGGAVVPAATIFERLAHILRVLLRRCRRRAALAVFICRRRQLQFFQGIVNVRAAVAAAFRLAPSPRCCGHGANSVRRRTDCGRRAPSSREQAAGDSSLSTLICGTLCYCYGGNAGDCASALNDSSMARVCARRHNVASSAAVPGSPPPPSSFVVFSRQPAACCRRQRRRRRLAAMAALQPAAAAIDFLRTASSAAARGKKRPKGRV